MIKHNFITFFILALLAVFAAAFKKNVYCIGVHYFIKRNKDENIVLFNFRPKIRLIAYRYYKITI